MTTQEDDPLRDLAELTKRIRKAYPPTCNDNAYAVVQGYVSVISAMHAYNYMEILERMDDPQEDLVERVLEMLDTTLHALKGVRTEVERLGSAPQGLALIIQRNIDYIEGRVRNLADSCPEDNDTDESKDGEE